jgi:hypothetical protein
MIAPRARDGGVTVGKVFALTPGISPVMVRKESVR